MAFLLISGYSLATPISGRAPKLRKYSLWVLVSLQKERDLNTAARIGQSLVKQNSVLMEENSKLEAMLGSARKEVTVREEHLLLCLSTPQPMAPLSSLLLSDFAPQTSGELAR